MKRSLSLLVIVLLCAMACARAHRAGQSSTNKTASEDVRAALCQIDQKDYASAQKTVERLLASDPKNPNLQKLLLGVQARQVKPDDKSADNIGRIHKVIQGYSQALKDLQLTADEKRQVDSTLIFLYRQLGEDELKQELLRRASDTQQSAKYRADAYLVLASRSWDCSVKITMTIPGPDASAAQKAQTCVNDGLGYVNKALSLEADNESGWSYKSELLWQAVKLAGLKGDQAQKASYQNQYNEARKRTQELFAKAKEQRDNESAREAEQQKKNDSFTVEQAAEGIKELTEFKAENSLDKVASELLSVQMDLTSLVAPDGGSNEQTQSRSNSAAQAAAQQKRDWKPFSPADDLTVELPDSVGPTAGGGYAASSEGVSYTVIPIARPAERLDAAVIEGVINTMARTQAGFYSRAWLEGGLGNRFELKFLRKDNVGGQPRKVYTYKLIGCTSNKDGALIVQAAGSHYYAIDINGANESDPRVQRVINSIKLK